jgi:hypothetical protein
MSGLAADYADANQTALSNFFVEKFNLVGRDAEWAKNRPTLGFIPRDTEKLKSAEGFYEALKVAGARAGGPGWGPGNTYHFSASSVRWHVEKPYAQYARMTFDNLMLARTPTATLLDLQESESEDVKDGMLNTLEFELWNDGTGNRGQIDVLGGSEATRVVTLKDSAQCYNFEHNMVVYGRTGAAGDGMAHSDLYRITDINPMAAQLTMTQLTNTGGQELADEDYLYAYGSATNYMPGIPTFVPASDPSDTLYGVARTGDPAKSGWRFPFKASISETIQRAFAQMGKYVDHGKKKFVVVLSTTDWLLLSMEREGRVFDDPSAMAKWGLEGLTVRTPFGPVTCIAIPQVVDGRGYIIDWSSWVLYTLGNLPHIAMEDGKVFQRLGITEPVADAHPVVDGDGIEMRLRIWKVLLCKRPMSNGTFPTVAS